MSILDHTTIPKPIRVFDAEVMVNLNPSTIKVGYESVLHCGVIRQMATIVDIIYIN